MSGTCCGGVTVDDSSAAATLIVSSVERGVQLGLVTLVTVMAGLMAIEAAGLEEMMVDGAVAAAVIFLVLELSLLHINEQTLCVK